MLPVGGAVRRCRGDHAATDGIALAIQSLATRTIRALSGQRILEVGSGVGNQTRFFVDEREQVIASDIEPHYLRELVGRFGDRKNVRIASYGFPLAATDADELLSSRSTQSCA